MNVLKYFCFVLIFTINFTLLSQSNMDGKAETANGRSNFKLEKEDVKIKKNTTEPKKIKIDKTENTTEPKKIEIDKTKNAVENETETAKDKENDEMATPKIKAPKIEKVPADKFTIEVLEQIGDVGAKLKNELLEMGLNRKQVHLIQGQNMDLVSKVVDLIKERTLTNKDAIAELKILNKKHLRINKELLQLEPYQKIKKMKKNLFKKCEIVLLTRLPKK